MPCDASVIPITSLRKILLCSLSWRLILPRVWTSWRHHNRPGYRATTFQLASPHSTPLLYAEQPSLTPGGNYMSPVWYPIAIARHEAAPSRSCSRDFNVVYALRHTRWTTVSAISAWLPYDFSGLAKTHPPTLVNIL